VLLYVPPVYFTYFRISSSFSRFYSSVYYAFDEVYIIIIIIIILLSTLLIFCCLYVYQYLCACLCVCMYLCVCVYFVCSPSNPEGLTALWVGNVLPDVPEKTLLNLFSQWADTSAFLNLSDALIFNLVIEVYQLEFCYLYMMKRSAWWVRRADCNGFDQWWKQNQNVKTKTKTKTKAARPTPRPKV